MSVSLLFETQPLMLIEQDKEKNSSLIPLPANPLRPEEKTNELPYAIRGTNKLNPFYAKKFGLPTGGYIVRPNPYREGSFIFIKDTDSERFDPDCKTSMKIINLDGSVHYNVQVRDVKGNLLKEYIEPTDQIIKKII